MVCNKRLYKHQSFLIFCLQNVLKVPSYELSKKGIVVGTSLSCVSMSHTMNSVSILTWRHFEIMKTNFAVNECNLSITDAPTYIRSMWFP